MLVNGTIKLADRICGILFFVHQWHMRLLGNGLEYTDKWPLIVQFNLADRIHGILFLVNLWHRRLLENGLENSNGKGNG